jgi:hypothetical protein
MSTITVEIVQLPVTTLDVSFVAHVTAPVEMPPRIYNVSLQEILSRSSEFKYQQRFIYEALTEKILADYNRLVEDSPIMDMFADPIKYERCSKIEWIHADPLMGGYLTKKA